ncbi:exopolysaccharide biosynthesis protein [Synechococcales cyanobacterium C]|uniref:Exopolysaccharide biosynthesis protein n=1 Tax=Petrachloros mirabilis ULC683 TaxID=2781853 RepID=A0A8K1ZWX2_9CYAN|nr:exopolysaccharide biosynthesis protein [Petrachloros mirabilis]NCJ06750.1 exopolysaccharide biosynthesis protein [Petrachloros mirabilis ULC683]
MARLSLELQRHFLETQRPSTRVTLVDVLQIAEERVFGLLFVMLALPSALPIPAPGYSIPFGILIFILAVQLIAGSARPWFPQWVLSRSFSLQQLQGILKSGIPWLRRIEAVTRPRYTPICTSFPGRLTIGIAVALMAVSMMIPIPGTNTLPAIGVLITGFGLLEDDGIISLAGLGLCVMGGILSLSILLAVLWGGHSLLDWIQVWLQRQ